MSEIFTILPKEIYHKNSKIKETNINGKDLRFKHEIKSIEYKTKYQLFNKKEILTQTKTELGQQKIQLANQYINYTKLTSNSKNNINSVSYNDQRKQFMEYYDKEIEDQIFLNDMDSKEYPNWTFVIPEVVDMYGQYNNFKNPQDIESKKKWIEKDNGEVYYQQYNRLIKLDKLNDLKNKIEIQRHKIYEFQIEQLPDNYDKETFMEYIIVIQEYSGLEPSKQKEYFKDKEFKATYLKYIDYIRKLDNIIDIDLLNYYNIKQGQVISSRTFPKKNLSKAKKEEYNSMIVQLNQLNKKHKTEVAYTKTTISKLKNKEKKIRQSIDFEKGKFFDKTWKSLSNDNKSDRISSFLIYSHKKASAIFHSANINLTEEYVNELSKKILELLNDKKMKTVKFRWRQSEGKIISITGIKIDKNEIKIDNTNNQPAVKKHKLSVDEIKLNNVLLKNIMNNTNIDLEGILKKCEAQKIICMIADHPIIESKMNEIKEMINEAEQAE